MSYGNPAYLLQSLAHRKKPPLSAEHRCGNKACPIHTTRLYTGADGVRRCLRCHELYGQQQAWEQAPETDRKPVFGYRKRPNDNGVGGRRVLTDEQVVEIRTRAEQGERYPLIAEDFGVTTKTVRNVALRKSYKDVE